MNRYQKIEIEGKVFVTGQDREKEYRAIFPEKPKGMSILDIGCHMGFYLFKAYSEGAARCVGVEKKVTWAGAAKKIAEKLSYKEVFIVNKDIFETETWQLRQVDTVLCLNVLHHMNLNMSKELLSKMDYWAKKRIVLVALDPSRRALHSIEKTPRGVNKRRFSVGFFKEFWPHYKITSMPSQVPPPGRSIINILKERKNCAAN